MSLASLTALGRRGFSIVEVLIAILVLALGLLGLGAVFPVVIAQQRESTDRIQGAVVLEGAFNQLENPSGLLADIFAQDGVDRDGVGTADDATLFGGWDINRTRQYGELEPGTNGISRDEAYSYLWEVDWAWGTQRSDPQRVRVGNFAGELLEFRSDYIADGGIRFSRQARASQFIGAGPPDDTSADVPFTSRLFPSLYSEDDPRYVWDFVLRRDAAGGIEAAVFVRRVDPGIRVPPGLSLSDVLASRGGTLPGLPPAAANRLPDSIVPVGFDAGVRTPSFDGTGVYAVPFALDADLINNFEGVEVAPEQDQGRRIVIRVSLGQVDSHLGGNGTGSPRREDVRLAAIVGQQLVDNLGVVREVREVVEVNVDNGYAIVDVDPPYVATQGRYRDAALSGPRPTFIPPPSGFGVDAATGIDLNSSEDRRTRLRQVVFTPGIPVAVSVRKLTR